MGDGKAEREIYLFVKLKLFLMSQVLLSNEQQESFRNAYLKKRKTSSCKSEKKKKHKDTIVKWAKGLDYTQSLKAYTGGRGFMS